MYKPTDLDHTDEFTMKDVTEDIINALASEKPDWKQLTPSK